MVPVGEASRGRGGRRHRRQALHARSLGFIHPTSGERLRFDAALPQDMRALLAALRGFDDKPSENGEF